MTKYAIEKLDSEGNTKLVSPVFSCLVLYHASTYMRSDVYFLYLQVFAPFWY